MSKVLAEKAAWEIAKREGIDLVIINPVFVVGPVLSNRVDATSIKLLKVMHAVPGHCAQIEPDLLKSAANTARAWLQGISIHLQ